MVAFNKVCSMLLSIFLLSCLHLVASDDHPASHRKRPVHDPVSNFFSELGDLFLDVDRTLTVQTAPKVELEDNLVTQILKPTSEYFDRIQKNYRNMQKRLGRLIGNTIGHKNRYSDHELSTVSPPHVLEEKQTFTTSAPNTIKSDYNPFAAADKERERLSRGFFLRQGDFSDSVADTDKAYLAESSNAMDECSNEILSDPVLERIRLEKCNRAEAEKARKDVNEAMLGTMKASQVLFPFRSEEFENLSKDILGRIGALVNVDQTESSRDPSDECSNEILTDPVLELLRQEKCHSSAPEQAAKDVRSLLDRKEAAHVSIPARSKDLEKRSKEYLKKHGYTLPEESLNTPEDECLNEIDSDPVLESIRKEKCARIDAEKQLKQNLKEAILNPEMARDILLPIFKSDFSRDFLKRRGDSIEPLNLKNEASEAPESVFDTNLRQILSDHSRWLLDNPLLNRWRLSSSIESSTDVYPTEVTDSTTENVPDETTEAYFIPTSEYKMVISESGESPAESRYYEVVNRDGVVEEEVDIVLEPRVEQIEEDDSDKRELKDAVILAFTSDGVPLKLRMGPEIENPLGYLHKALKSAGVSLNVPVESYDDLEPVGKEVLKVGSGLLSRAVYIDVSNRNELKTFLKSLMKLKAKS